MYEPVILTRRKVLKKRAYQPIEETEAPEWDVTQEYAVNGIYMTSTQLIAAIKNKVVAEAKKKDVNLVSYRVLDAWAVWKVFYTEYHALVKYRLAGSPVSGFVIAAIATAVVLVLAILFVYAIGDTIIEPIWGVIPPKWRPIVGTAIAVGVSLLLIGGGIYLATKWMKRK